MKSIFVIGAGAVGISLATFLKQANRPVILLRPTHPSDPTREVKARVQVPELGQVLEEQLVVGALEDYEELPGIVVVATKSQGNVHLAEKLKQLKVESPLVLLQNGIGNEAPFLLHQFMIYRSLLYAAALKEREFQTKFWPIAPSPLFPAADEASEQEAKEIATLLSTPLLQFKALSEYSREEIWRKLIINCVFNSICALLDAPNGIFAEDQIVFSKAKQLITELTHVANMVGVQLSQEELENAVLQVSRRSPQQLCSTLQDLRSERETEISMLNLGVRTYLTTVGYSEERIKELLPLTLQLGTAIEELEQLSWVEQQKRRELLISQILRLDPARFLKREPQT